MTPAKFNRAPTGVVQTLALGVLVAVQAAAMWLAEKVEQARG